MASRLAAVLLTTILVGLPAASRAGSATFRLPLEPYPIGDNCLAWGALNGNFQRCGQAGKHVADDACAPNGTPVLAISDGRVCYATEVADCFTNWGWVMVVEHTLPDETRVCSVYGHCAPAAGIRVGEDVALGQAIAVIENPCVAHIHFGIYRGAFGAAMDVYPDWLTGYMPQDRICAGYERLFPGNWVNPVEFVLERVAIEARPWTIAKQRYR